MVDGPDGSTHDSAGERALGVLAGVPAHHGFWDDVDAFVARLRELAAEKLEARERQRQEEALTRALDRLRGIGKEVLTFHEALDVVGWSVVDFDLGAWPSVAALAIDLYDTLARHAALQQDQPANRTAAKERRRELDALDETIVAVLEKMRGLRTNRRRPPAVHVESGAHAATAMSSAGDAETDELHAPIDPDRQRYSVFSLAEERRLMAPRPGVCLVFASAATGLDSIAESMTAMGRRRGALVEVPRTIVPREVGAWIRTQSPADDRGSVTAWQRLGRWSGGLDAGLRDLLDSRRTAGPFRVVLVGGPPEGHSFVGMAARRDLAGELDDVLPCGRWPLAAIKGRVRDAGIDADGSDAADVMTATRGWHRLLDVLWMRKAPQRGLAPMIDAFHATFRSPGGYSGFRAALGLNAFPEAEAAFRLLARRQQAPMTSDDIARVVEKETGIGQPLVGRAIEFLVMFQVLEQNADGTLGLDPLAREVFNSEV